MTNSSLAATKWLIPLFLMSGCSILLEPKDQCSVSSDCVNTLAVCHAGLCVMPDGGSDGGVESTDPYVLSYFRSDQTLESDSLHLAYSSDGRNWKELNENAPVYTLSGIGSNHIRDPFILKKNDGTFVFLATDWTVNTNPDYWGNPSSSIIVADSVDLITFTNPRRLEVTPLQGPNGSEMHAWAPEAFFDAERQEYAIIWSGNDTSDVNRIYVSYTNDFETLVNPTPEVFFDPGYSVIDGTVVPYNGRNYLFFKDETNNNGGALTGSGKDVQIARTQSSSLAAGSFMRWDIDYLTRGLNQNTRRATEGPVVVKVPNQNIWFMCADFFAQAVGTFGCWRSTDIEGDPNSWVELPADQYHFPTGAKHSSIVRVTTEQLTALIARYGEPQEYQIRSNALEGSTPTYVAHSYYHGIVTTLADRSNGQLEGDFAWKIVRGLANPSDPDLISFESVLLPGMYLLINASNPSEFPNCPEGSNKGALLCGLDVSERHHLTWLRAFEDTTAFKNAATWRKTPALNNDTNMVSFQWYGDTSMYMVPISSNLFGRVISGATMMTNASFTLEVR